MCLYLFTQRSFVMLASFPPSGSVERPMGPREQAMVSAATRVGLSDEPSVIRKALELERLLAMKLTGGGGFSDACRNLLCLDLAADSLGQPVDKMAIIKHSGVKKSAYQNSRSTAERLLEMRQTHTAATICLKLQCVGCQQLAEQILNAFQRSQEIDLSNPQYACMAVYQACKITKTKISKSKLLHLSGLKTTQWPKLETVWTKFVEENFAKEKGAKGTGANNIAAKCIDPVEMDTTSMKSEKSKELEPYESWRKRILEEAYWELRELEKKDNNMQITPRKSPRKRDIPIKNETDNIQASTKLDRSKGVRLLF